MALGPFQRTTKELESTAGNGRHGSIWEWLPMIEALLFTMKEGQKRVIAKYYTAHPLSIAYQNAWEKLHKWYEESDKSHTIYAAATIFSPMAKAVVGAVGRTIISKSLKIKSVRSTNNFRTCWAFVK